MKFILANECWLKYLRKYLWNRCGKAAFLKVR